MSRIFIVFILISLFYPLNAQQILTLTGPAIDKADYNIIMDLQKYYMNTIYVSRVDVVDELINGREYVPYYLKSKIKPLLSDGKKRSGSLLFNGRRYSNLNLEYDTFLDQLIYSDSTKLIDNKIFKIALNKDPVESFTLGFEDDSMIFRHFGGGQIRSFNLPEGFYEVVYDGGKECIIRHQSFLVESDGLYEYRYTPAWYVKVGESFSRIRSSGDFIRLFGKDSDLVRKYMRANRVHFRRAGKNEIAGVLRYYDSLRKAN